MIEFHASAPETLGVELELQLLDGNTLDLADRITPLMERLGETPYVKPEMIQNTVEIITRVCADSTEAQAHLVGLASGVRAHCRELGLRLCGAGTHPFSQSLALITPGPRYRRMERSAGFSAHSQIAYATHVHVGVTSGDEAVAVMRALNAWLPLLIALAANSPFWRGYDTDCASYRQRILAASRSYGVPPSFNDWREFNYYFTTTRRAGLFESVNDIHWDIRPRPQFGTVEVRAMDAQPTIADTAALAGFVRTLVAFLRRHGEVQGGLPGALPWWIEKENHYQATRAGMMALYICEKQGTVRPLAEIWRDAVEALAPLAAELGESSSLEHLRHMAGTGPGYERQRRLYQRTGSLREVVESLADELDVELARAGEATPAPALSP